ncbi:uncharacterized protein N7506_002348 [Penicillium brevicompactum]|uniref:uncharacterized protein n=1 Tax=Penicillium brevicompactum TaxID=5074 RepID=UPI00254067EA|nr:uncharacterized protein N7506_002348 [Penicillium brevicompactum]KAJ5349095.1 hypothetical protein N7506_002348 [Penicillium brevicompactum]
MSKDSKADVDFGSGNDDRTTHEGLGTITDHHDVFGEIPEDGPNYHNIGLGVLSMPLVFATVGLVPGNILLVAMGCITTWSNYMVGVIKLRHPQVYGIDDVGRMLFGRIGFEVFGAAYATYFTFVAGSAMLSISISLNALSTHAICTAGFVACAAVIGFMFGSLRTLDRIGFLAWIGATSIIIAVFAVTIAVGLQDRPSAAPQTGHWKSDYKLFNNPSFTEAISAVSTLVFTYAGTPAFFNIVAEMRQPLMYNRSLAICQTTVTLVYIIVGTIVYYFCGSYVASPALGSAGDTVKKVSYGIALPGLVVSCVLFIHLSAKHVFVRILRGSDHLTANSVTHWVTWLSSTLGITIVAYIIASAIPVFSELVSLIGALLGTFLTFQPYAGMWLLDNWKSTRTWKWRFGVIWSMVILFLGTFLMIGGSYGSAVGIRDSFLKDGGSSPWSCADNSNSV